MSSQDSNSSGSQMLLEDDATVSSKPSSSQSVRKKKTVKKKVPPLTLNMTNCKYEVVQSCCKNFGFKIVDDPKLWSLFWIDTGVSIERILDMTPFQKINHFPGMHEICRKNHLARNLVRFSKVFPKEYNFSPKTWSLPVDWVDFRMAHKARKKTVYIVKPDHGCQGKGIFLARGPKQIAKIQKKQKLDQFMVVQKYVGQPFLIDGFKFDLRVYVLVTCMDPLRIFIYKDGLARFATEPYAAPNAKNLETLYMHLTNYAINKTSDKFNRNEDDGSKRSMESVFEVLRGRFGVDTDKVWREIADVVVKTLLVVQPQISRNLDVCCRKVSQTSSINPSAGPGSQCFEILGFDILLDKELKPWVLEVNHSPSFACDSDLDKRIKSGVISDALSLVNMSAGKQAKFEREQRSKSKGRLFAPSSTSLTNVSEKNGVSGDKNKAFGRVETGQRKTATAGASEVRGCLGSPPLPSIPKAAEEVHGTKQNDSDEESGEEDQSDDEPGEECAEQQESVLDPAAQAAIENRLATLLARYSDPSLEKLSLTESRRSGNYQRVFPPNNMEDLTRYLHIVAKTGHLFESGRETLAVRARRDFLQAKKQAVVDKLNFLDDWRVSRKAKQGASKQIRHSRTSAAADHRLSLCEYHRLSSTSSPSVNGSKLTLSFSIEGHNRTLPPLKRTPPARQRMSLSVTNIGSLL